MKRVLKALPPPRLILGCSACAGRVQRYDTKGAGGQIYDLDVKEGLNKVENLEKDGAAKIAQASLTTSNPPL